MGGVVLVVAVDARIDARVVVEEGLVTAQSVALSAIVEVCAFQTCCVADHAKELNLVCSIQLKRCGCVWVG